MIQIDFLLNNISILKSTLVVLICNPRLDTFVRNVESTFSHVNPSNIKNAECEVVAKMIKVTLNGIKTGMSLDKDYMLEYCKMGDPDEDPLRSIIAEAHAGVSDGLIQKLSTMYSTIVLHKPLLDKKIEIISSFADLETAGIGGTEYAINKVSKVMTDTLSMVKANITDVSDKTFLLEADVSGMDELLEEREKEHALTLKTGIKSFDDRLGGGFKASKAYCGLAVPGAFKSGTMLNLALAIKDNPENKFDPMYLDNLKPLILTVSRENTRKQCVDRCLCYYGYSQMQLQNMTTSEYTEAIQKHIMANEETGISIGFRISPKQKMCVHDYYALVEEYKMQGFKIIMIFDDYIKHISVKLSDAEKIENKQPGDKKAEEVSDLTRNLQIPFMTCNQLNRSGIDEVKTGKAKGEDYLKRTGLHHMEGSVNAAHSYELMFALDRHCIKNTWFMSFLFLKDRDNSAAVAVEDAASLSNYFILKFKDDGVFFRFDNKKEYHSIDEIAPRDTGVKDIFADMAKGLKIKQDEEEKKAKAISILTNAGITEKRIEFMSDIEIFELAAYVLAGNNPLDKISNVPNDNMDTKEKVSNIIDIKMREKEDKEKIPSAA